MSRHHGSAFRLKTAAELARDPGAQPPRGEFLYRPTKQVRFPSPIVSIRRRYRQEGVYCERGRTVYYRSYKRPADPKTARQAEQRAGFGGSQSDWKNLTEAERAGWSAYGARWFAGEYSSSPGPNTYTKAQSCRRGWGETTLSRTPPVLPPPAMPLRLEEVPAPEVGQIAFRLEHAQRDLTGCRIEVRMTPATVNGRKPQEPKFARAGETAPESFFPLGASGAVYLLERPRFAVTPGERFGLGVRLITPEGIPGPELRVDLIRMAPEEGGGAAPAGNHPGFSGWLAPLWMLLLLQLFSSAAQAVMIDDQTSLPRLAWRPVWETTLPDHGAMSPTATKMEDLAFSPDGRHLGVAVAGFNHQTLLLDAVDGRVVREYRMPEDLPPPAHSVGFTTDGTRLLSGTNRGDVLIWETASGVLLRTLKAHEKMAQALAVSPDGGTVVTGSSDAVRVWSVADWSLRTTLFSFASERVRASTLAFSSDGELLACDGGPPVFRTSDWQPLSFSSIELGSRRHFLPSNHLLTGDADWLINVWSPCERTEAFSVGPARPADLRRAADTIDAVAASPDGLLLAGGTNRGNVVLYYAPGGWDCPVLGASDTGEVYREPGTEGRSLIVQSAVFSEDGSRLRVVRGQEEGVLSGLGGQAAVKPYIVDEWDLASRTRVAQYSISGGVEAGFALAHHRPLLVQKQVSGAATLYDLSTSASVSVCLPQPPGGTLLFSPDDKFLYAGGSVLGPPNYREGMREEEAHSDGPAAFSADSRFLAVFVQDGIRVSDLRSRSPVLKLDLDTVVRGQELAFSPAGDRLLVSLVERIGGPAGSSAANFRRILRVYSFPMGVALWERAEMSGSEGGGFSRLAWSPDGASLASVLESRADASAYLLLLDAASGQERTHWVFPGSASSGRGAAPASLHFISSGAALCAVARDGTIRLLDIAHRFKAGVLDAHFFRINVIRFSPDGHSFATASDDGAVKLWSVPEEWRERGMSY